MQRFGLDRKVTLRTVCTYEQDLRTIFMQLLASVRWPHCPIFSLHELYHITGVVCSGALDSEMKCTHCHARKWNEATGSCDGNILNLKKSKLYFLFVSGNAHCCTHNETGRCGLVIMWFTYATGQS